MKKEALVETPHEIDFSCCRCGKEPRNRGTLNMENDGWFAQSLGRGLIASLCPKCQRA